MPIRLKRSVNDLFFQGKSLDLLTESGSSASSFYSYFSGFMSFGDTVIYCGPEGFLIWECSCVASVSLMFFCVRAVCSMDACHIFPRCMLAIIPLTGECDFVVTRTCTEC